VSIHRVEYGLLKPLVPSYHKSIQIKTASDYKYYKNYAYYQFLEALPNIVSAYFSTSQSFFSNKFMDCKNIKCNEI